MANLQKNFLFDMVVLVSLLAIMCFKESPFAYYISPVVSLCIAVYFIGRKFFDFKKTMMIMMDETLGEDEQMHILKILTTYYDHYEQLKDIKTRQSGDLIYVDLLLEFEHTHTYGDMLKLIADISEDLEKTIPNCFVSLVIDSERR